MNAKKIIAEVFAVTLLFGALPTAKQYISEKTLSTSAASTYESLTYEVKDNKYAVITGADKDVKSIVIPEKIDGYPVTAIASDAFNKHASLESIVIPEGVTEIGYDCFRFCSALQSVQFPKSLKTIHGSCFQGCISLEKIDIPDGVSEIGRDAFRGCISLLTLELPSGLSEVDIQIACECTSLESVVIKNGPSSICMSAFYGCTSLKTVSIPVSVTQIGSNAFKNCPIKDVYYASQETQWNNISGRDQFGIAEIHLQAKPPVTEYKNGDVNHDGVIDADDASSILAYYAYTSTTTGTPLELEDFLKEYMGTK